MMNSLSTGRHPDILQESHGGIARVATTVAAFLPIIAGAQVLLQGISAQHSREQVVHGANLSRSLDQIASRSAYVMAAISVVLTALAMLAVAARTWVLMIHA